MFSIGQFALIGMISHIFFIWLTWRVMLKLNFDPIIRKDHPQDGRIFLLFLAIMIGTGVSRFVLDILQWSQDLIYLF
ncbi:DUF1146 family protein [Oceanobacillus indicireducens]|uniref:DUF1146 domain-containing protein n=1 Tax=Oceanobacillus indicireducens TaxID=1004261 RepID=A0A917XT62_9BACI|nr:DUF1146 family protein [Oceanobacillus indicireducens]GGN50131.1 hypothetical protein GCM10007971_03350 [Oceanobacillus indicireducens]